MEETITSSINLNYYGRAVAGFCLFLYWVGYLLYRCLLGDFLHPWQGYGLTVLSCATLWVFYYFFSKSWKQISVSPTEITVFDYVRRTRITIPFTDITGINTYQARSNSGRGGGALGYDFVIEYGDNKWISFNEAWYDNYGKLTMAIYRQKYGPGHGRERYLARHGR